MTFNNSAAYDSITLGPNAYKQLLDTAGDRALAAGEFVFGAVPITEGAPIPTDQNGNPLPTDTDVNGAQYYKSTNDTLGYIAFGTATFTQGHVKTGDSAAYVYKLFEVIPNDAVNANVAGGKKSYAEADEAQRVQAGWTKDGVTYDSSVYYARVTVKIDGNSTDNVNHVTAKISYHKSPEPNAAVIIGNGVTFKNVYDPADAVLTGDARIKGQKTLKGRDALADEAFTFELTAFDDFTKQALESDALVFGSDRTATKLTARVEGAENGKPRDFVFDSAMTFSKVGTYRFAIKESVPKPAAPNMTYDPATAEAVVTITDVGGKLKAEVSYINPQAPSIIDRAVFTNVYHAEGALAEGIEVSKVLTGRAMKKTGEFSATVVGIDNTAGNTTDDEANAKLPKADTKILFPKASAGTTVGKKILGDILFTQEDAGKTFSYIVAEDVPAEGIDTEGVSYDRSQYRVDLAVTDTGTGKLSVTPTVTKIVDRDGKSLAHPETAQVAAFENRYEPAQTVIEDTTGVLPLTKKLSGRGWLDTDKFEFALTAKSLNGKTDADSLANIPMPADAHAVVTKDSAPHYDSTTGAVPDATIKDFGFKGITYKQTGTYVYEVREVIPDDATNPDVPGKTYGQAGADERAKAGWTRGGVTYDSAKVATVTCEVKDNLTGQLYVEASCDPAAVPTFTNTYAAATPADASVEIQATKTFVNHQLGAGEFEFGVAPFKNDGKLGDEVLSGTNGAAGSDQPAQVNFTGKLSYNTVDLAKAVKAGYANESIDGSGRATWTLKYLAYERALDANKHPGVTQTASSFNFTVTVTDNGDGKLSASANYPAGGLAFVNTYNTEGDNSVLYTPTGAKVLKLASEGLAAPDIDGRYRFTLTGEDGAPMPAAGGSVTVNDQSSVNFGAIAFTLDMLDGVEQAHDGSRSRTFTYAVKEGGFVPGVTNDADSKSFKLTLKDDGKGSLTVTPEGDPRLPLFTFVNTYTAQVPESDPVTTDGLFAKVLTGRDWMRGDAFTFVIEPVVDGTPMPDVTKVVLRRESAKAGEPQAFGFSKIRFTHDDMKGSIPSADGTGTEKTFEYTVREVVPEDAAKIPGITYSDNVAHLEITLRDDGKGNLTATAAVEDGIFTNRYATGTVDFDAAAGLKIVKNMTGRAIAKDAFSFIVEGMDNESAAKLNGGHGLTVGTAGAPLVGNTATETLSVATKLSFAQEDVGKTYRYTVSEADGGKIINGVTYDGAKHELAFAVADGGSGVLEVAVSLDGEKVATYTGAATSARVADPVAVTFNNRYDAGSVDVGGDGAAAIKAHKTLTGRPLEAGEFSFSVVNTLDDAAKLVTSGTNDAQGDIAFEPISYTMEKLNNDVADGLAVRAPDGVYTYAYAVSEDTSSLPAGVTPVVASFPVEVLVTDSGTGSLGAQVVYPEGSDGSLEFRNAYGTGVGGATELAVGGAKVLKVESGETAPDIAGKFTFTLTGSKDAPMPEGAKDGVKTATNDASGSVDLGTISYTMESVFGSGSGERTKTFDYTVTESGEVPGVVNDLVSSRSFTVTVTDNGDGTLSAVSSEKPGAQFTFTNTYSVKPSEGTLTGEGGFTITKKLDGRDLREGEFEFALVSQGEGEQTVVTAKNDASGKVAFPAISFNAPGEYRYRLAEVDGGLGGVTYDTTVYDVTAKVVDNGDGTLGVTWSVSKDGKALEGKEIVFANSYKAAGTSITFNAAKVLTGRELKKGEFTFELRDANGKVLQTVKNGALTEGGYAPIAFDPITYDEPGTYDYRIVEVKGDAEGITYDATVFTYHVVVTDDGNGQLQVEWTVGETGVPVFQNVFVKPGDPKPAKPADPGNGGSGDKLIQTGDNALVGMFTAAFAGIAAIGAGFTARRKKK